MIKKEVVITSDGSTSIFLPDWNESYHSKHGAIQEANHVFIENGFDKLKGSSLQILEIGFGTGLNALLTLNKSIQQNKQVYYTGIEAYPVSDEIVNTLNYSELLEPDEKEPFFKKIHAAQWDHFVKIHPMFHLKKKNIFFHEIDDSNLYDIIYFDAFGFRVQPELWSEEIFKIMFNALKKDGLLLTYACRSPIKKTMETSGFTTEKLPGPPGKREMLRATKI